MCFPFFKNLLIVTVLSVVCFSSVSTQENLKQVAKNYVEKQDFQAAIEIYQKIIRENPQDIESKKELARLYGFVQDYDMGINMYNELLNQFPNDYDIIFGKAQIYSWKGDLTTAEDLYRRIVQESPDYFDAHIGLIRVLIWQQKSSEALQMLEQPFLTDSDNISVLELLVQTKYDAGRLKDASAYNKRLLEIDPDSETGLRYRTLLSMYSVEIGGIYDSVTDRDNWQENSISLSYRPKKNMNWIFGFASFSRFGLHDQQVSLNIFTSLKNNLNINGLLSAGFNKKFLPKQRINIEISYALSRIVLITGGHYMKFPLENVTVGVMGFEFYLPYNIFTDYKYYHSEGEYNNTSNTHVVRLHILKEDKYQVSAGFASGGEAFHYASEEELFFSESKSYLSNFLLYINNTLGLRAAFSHTVRKDSYKRTSTGIGLLYRF
ncbi:YaiO family outer membrane beta-barrel protein [candidate division KSB1 bacterium]